MCSKNKGAVTAKLICVFVFAYEKVGFLMTRLIYTFAILMAWLYIFNSTNTNI